MYRLPDSCSNLPAIMSKVIVLVRDWRAITNGSYNSGRLNVRMVTCSPSSIPFASAHRPVADWPVPGTGLSVGPYHPLRSSLAPINVASVLFAHSCQSPGVPPAVLSMPSVPNGPGRW